MSSPEPSPPDKLDILPSPIMKPKTMKIIPWCHTELRNSIFFSEDEIKHLLIDRGAKDDELTGNKMDLIKHLKEKYTVNLDPSIIESLTIEKIKIESKLLRNDFFNRLPRAESRDEWIRYLENQIDDQIKVRLLESVAQPGTFDIPYSRLQPIKINDNEFAILSNTNEIWKYNIIENKWTQWIKDVPTQQWPTSICYDSINKLLFIYHFEGEMLRIDLERKMFKRLCCWKNKTRNLDHAQLLFIDGSIHLFGYRTYDNSSMKHWIFDDEIEEFKLFHRFANAHGDIIHLKSKKTLIKIGASKTIEKYDIASKKWFESDTDSTSLVDVCDPSGLKCLTRNDKYCILFDYDSESNDIAILDMDRYKMITTDIGCPMSGTYDGIITNERSKHELILYGYVRYCWNKYQIGLQRFPPEYLIRLMGSWLSDEYLHIIQCSGLYDTPTLNDFDTKHFKIRVDDIFNASL